jgi:hypothetical protein
MEGEKRVLACCNAKPPVIASSAPHRKLQLEITRGTSLSAIPKPQVEVGPEPVEKRVTLHSTIIGEL